MVRVRFVADAIYETEGPGRGPLFREGDVHDLRPDQARRWIRRGLAKPLDKETDDPVPEVTITPKDLRLRAASDHTKVTPDVTDTSRTATAKTRRRA